MVAQMFSFFLLVVLISTAHSTALGADDGESSTAVSGTVATTLGADGGESSTAVTTEKAETTTTTTTTTTTAPPPTCQKGGAAILPTSGDCPNEYVSETSAPHGKICCPFYVSQKFLSEKSDQLEPTVDKKTCKPLSEECSDYEVCEKTVWSDGKELDTETYHCYAVECPLVKKIPEVKFCTEDANCQKTGMFCHMQVVTGSRVAVYLCCGADRDLCPGGYYPRPAYKCGTEDYSHIPKHALGTNGLTGSYCCPKLASSTFKQKNIVRLLHSFPTANRTCKVSTDCNAGEFCDESVADRPEKGQISNCYTVPETYGEKPTKLVFCDKHKDCESGQMCDTKLHDFKNQKDLKSVGMCAQFTCPLTTKPISGACQADGDCTDEKTSKYCHPVGKGKKYNACCEVDATYQCPGGAAPTKVKGKFNHDDGQPFECSKEEFGYPFNQPERCCQGQLISKDLYDAGLSDKLGTGIEATDPSKTCTAHADCQADEFCGPSVLKSSPATGVNANNCYKKPQCTGTAVVAGDKTGLKTCQNEKNACGDNEACDLDLGQNGNGMCCLYQCKGAGLMPEVTDAGTTKKICEDCSKDGKEYDFCGKNLVNDDTHVNVCEKTATGKYRQCTYKRTKPQLPAGYDSPLRIENHLLMPCDNDWDCRTKMGNDLKLRARCVGPAQQFPEGSKKFCVKGDLCGDLWLLRTKELDCTKDGKCPGDQGTSGVCEASTLATNKAKHCCPKVSAVNTKYRITVDHPYRSNVDCNNLADCAGERRFCDPLKKKCMYHMKDFQHGEATNEKCKIDDEVAKVCGGDKRKVCMMKELDDEPQCYRHPWDECEKNHQCGSGNNMYCAPRTAHTKKEDYEKEFRKCYDKPPKAVLLDTGGLKACITKEDCGVGKYVCVPPPPSVVLPPSSQGYCEQTEEYRCKGQSRAIHDLVGLKTCTSNTDCLDTDFCDKGVKPSVGDGKGICCSRPEKCGGDVVTAEDDVGLKICSNDGGCSLKDGEICSTKFTTVGVSRSDTLWGDEGVCCRMMCPASTDADLEPVSSPAPAGELCAGNSCVSESRVYRTCVDTKDTGEKRCCEYKRKAEVCPASKANDVYLDAQSKAVNCSNVQACPDNSECIDGYCCKVDKCPDTKIPMKEQKSCTKNDECGQPFEYMAKCISGHCCPVTSNGLIHQAFLSTKPCTKLADCGQQPRTFCLPEKNVCGYFGNQDSSQESMNKCPADGRACKAADGHPGVCTYGNSVGTDLYCWKDPTAESNSQKAVTKATEAPKKEEESSNATTIIIIVVVVIILLAAIAGGAFFWHKRTMKKREAKKKKEEKDRKTETTTEAGSKDKSKSAESDVGSVKSPGQKNVDPVVPPDRKYFDPPPASDQKNVEPLAPQFITM